jgi:hypothetical protein
MFNTFTKKIQSRDLVKSSVRKFGKKLAGWELPPSPQYLITKFNNQIELMSVAVLLIANSLIFNSLLSNDNQK